MGIWLPFGARRVHPLTGLITAVSTQTFCSFIASEHKKQTQRFIFPFQCAAEKVISEPLLTNAAACTNDGYAVQLCETVLTRNPLPKLRANFAMNNLSSFETLQADVLAQFGGNK